eukprot:gene5300-6766_t
MVGPRLAGLLLWVACALWLVGCAQPPQVEGQASQSFSAIFELRGNAHTGGLALISPLGSRIAQLEWKDGHAQLTSAQESRTSDSLDALLQDVTGTRIPVAALFAWLKGVQTTVPGWRADLSALEQGRL